MPNTLTRPLPPTADVPEYTGYPVRYLVGSRSHPLTHAATYGAAQAALTRLNGSPAYGPVSEIHAEQVAPDETGVITAPWSGGTWGGRCGSTRWICDPDGAHRNARITECAAQGESVSAWQSHTARDAVSTGQALWVRGFERAATLGGFRVECQEPMRHDGPCQVQRWAWDPRAVRPLPDLR